MQMGHVALRRWWRWRVYILPALLVVALTLPSLPGGDYRVDTGRYAATALHAYQEGTFWTLERAGALNFAKPPLVFWIHGLLLIVTGPALWAVRLPVMLAAVGAVCVTVDATRRVAGTRAGLLSGIVLATTIEFFRHTRQMSLDIWQTLFLMIAAWCVLVGWKWDRIGLVVLSGVGIGLALMTKPFHVAIAIPIFAGWLMWMQRPRLAMGMVGATGVALAVAGPWHLSMWIQHGDAFVDQYILHQSLERAIGQAEFEWFPWWWYARPLLQNYWPWLIAFAGAVVMWIRGRCNERDRAAIRMGLLWVGVWLVVMSAFADKRARYIILLYPFMAMVCGVWLARVMPAKMARTGRVRMDLAIVIATIVGIALPIAGVRLHRAPDGDEDGLVAFLQEKQGEEVWGMKLDTGRGGVVYLKTKIWPIHPKEGGPTPGAGALLIYDTRLGAPASDGGEIMYRDEVYVVVRGENGAHR